MVLEQVSLAFDLPSGSIKKNTDSVMIFRIQLIKPEKVFAEDINC